jgi:hypothetical protein
MTLFPQSQYNNVTSRIGGDYLPFLAEIDNRFNSKYPDTNTRYLRQYSVFFTFDLMSRGIVIGDISDSYDFMLSDVLAANSTLYAVLNVNNTEDTLQNSPYITFSTNNIVKPTMTPNNQNFGIYFELDLRDFSIKNRIVFGSTTYTIGSFYSFSNGVNTTDFDNNGDLFINFSFFFNVQNKLDIENSIYNFNTTLLNELDLATFKADAIEKIEFFYDRISTEEPLPSGNFFFSLNLLGAFDPTTINGLKSFIIGTNLYYFSDINNNIYICNHWTNYITLNDESFLIEYLRIIKYIDGFESDFSNIFAAEILTEKTTLNRINLDTQIKSRILVFENQGVMINGLVRNSNGFYLTGTYFNNNPLMKSTEADAFLASYSSSFVKQNEIVIGGSKTDVGVGIAFDGQDNPVWVVRSNSTDGDFEFASTANPNNFNRTYFVRFSDLQ